MIFERLCEVLSPILSLLDCFDKLLMSLVGKIYTGSFSAFLLDGEIEVTLVSEE